MKKISLKSFFLINLGLASIPYLTLANFEKTTTSKELTDLPQAEFLNQFLHYINVIIALIFIFFLLTMLAAGIEFLTAGGDEGSLEKAHALWRTAFFGIVSALTGYIVVNLIKFFI